MIILKKVGKMKYKKLIKVTIWTISIGFILFYNIPFKINREYEAIEIKIDDESYLETKTINMTGKYKFNIFTDDTFEGQITIPEYEITSWKMNTIDFDKNGAMIWYRLDTGFDHEGRVNFKYEALGDFYYNPFKPNPVILLQGRNKPNTPKEMGGWGDDEGYCIVFNTSSREEALKIVSKYEDIYPPEFQE